MGSLEPFDRLSLLVSWCECSRKYNDRERVKELPPAVSLLRFVFSLFFLRFWRGSVSLVRVSSEQTDLETLFCSLFHEKRKKIFFLNYNCEKIETINSCIVTPAQFYFQFSIVIIPTNIYVERDYIYITFFCIFYILHSIWQYNVKIFDHLHFIRNSSVIIYDNCTNER